MPPDLSHAHQIESLFKGLRPSCLKRLSFRDYSQESQHSEDSRASIHEEDSASADTTQKARFLVKETTAQEILQNTNSPEFFIPGVEILERTIHKQAHRGRFAELSRYSEPTLQRQGFWPKQWSVAQMHAKSSKGFHIHPPHVPEGTKPSDWFTQLYLENKQDKNLRPYDLEQWDLMFFIQGCAEILLVDERAGLERQAMHFYIEGDDRCMKQGVSLVIPPGVAHAIRAEGSSELLAIYGTSTTFSPQNEGRIADAIERAELPCDWLSFLGS